MTFEMKWEDPPSKRTEAKTLEWKAIFAGLAAAPGRWALVKVCKNHANAAPIVAQLKHGRGIYTATPPRGKWEATARTIREGDDAGKVGIYARYMGPEEA